MVAARSVRLSVSSCVSVYQFGSSLLHSFVDLFCRSIGAVDPSRRGGLGSIVVRSSLHRPTGARGAWARHGRVVDPKGAGSVYETQFRKKERNKQNKQRGGFCTCLTEEEVYVERTSASSVVLARRVRFKRSTDSKPLRALFDVRCARRRRHRHARTRRSAAGGCTSFYSQFTDGIQTPRIHTGGGRPLDRHRAACRASQQQRQAVRSVPAGVRTATRSARAAPALPLNQ